MVARRDVVPVDSPTSPWWSTVDDEQTVPGALSHDDDDFDHQDAAGDGRQRRRDWPLSDRQRAGIHLEPRHHEFLTAWRLIHGRRPLGMSVWSANASEAVQRLLQSLLSARK